MKQVMMTCRRKPWLPNTDSPAAWAYFHCSVSLAEASSSPLESIMGTKADAAEYKPASWDCF